MSEIKSEISNQYLTFMMEGENYALSVAGVSEVLTVPKVTHIPRMPAFMRGIVNLRGAVVPILDLKLKFGIGETVITPKTAIVVVEIALDGEAGEESILRLGVFADSVEKVVTLAASEIEPPPRIGTRIRKSFIDGMGHLDDGFVAILNMREILTDEDLAMAESAGEIARETVLET
jgi:purine-binding chemotaxis protein CheW